MKVKDLLSDKSKWCQNASSKNNGQLTSYCLMFAIFKAYDIKEAKVIIDKAEKYITEKYGQCNGVTIFNDTHTYEQVIKLVNDLGI